MVRDKGMMGDMFGNMSFDSSDEEEGVVAMAEEIAVALALAVAVADAGEEVEISGAADVGSFGCEVGYQPESGPAILVRQIRERGLSFQLWPAAAGMCRYLETGGREGLRGARVLELGAGTGMAGVMAARLGARVTLTDLPHVLQNLQRNVEMNLEDVEACGGSLDVQPLRWGVQEDVTALTVQPPDLILASDCVYYDTLFEPLMQTLKWLFGIGDAETEKAAVGPVLLLAHLRRWKKDGHFFRMAAKCFDVEVVHKHPLPDNARTGVLVYKFTRKLSSR